MLFMTDAAVWIAIVAVPIVFLGLLIFHCLLIVIMPFTRKNQLPPTLDNYQRFFTLETIRLATALLNGRVHVSGLEKLPDGPFTVVSNHRSIFDPMLTMRALYKYKLTFISKKENFDLPLFGRLMTYCGSLSLDRDDARSAVKTFNQAVEMARSGYCTMGIYPEGHVNRTRDKLLPFHSGSFKIAQKTGYPLAIIVTEGGDTLWTRFFRPAHIRIEVLDVLPAEDLKDKTTTDIADRVRELMLAALSPRV